jgi:hypothetical protein
MGITFLFQRKREGGKEGEEQGERETGRATYLLPTTLFLFQF